MAYKLKSVQIKDNVVVILSWPLSQHKSLHLQAKKCQDCKNQTLARKFAYFRALQFPPEAWLRISLHHASLTWIYIRPNGRVGIRVLGEAGFMPVNKMSFL